MRYNKLCKYEGNTICGLREGKGKFNFSNGYACDGDWRNDRLEGTGVITSMCGKVVYEGEFRDSQLHGRGIFY